MYEALCNELRRHAGAGEVPVDVGRVAAVFGVSWTAALLRLQDFPCHGMAEAG